MATTTNYGWTTPDDTGLVKDGASAIRTLGSSVDTTVKALNPGTTAGDLDYYTAATTKARIAIGSSGQVLSVSGGVPAWTTISSGGMTLLSTTALSGTSTTVSSISGSYTDLLVIVNNPYVNSSSSLKINPNSTTGISYNCGVFNNAIDQDSNILGSNLPTATTPTCNFQLVIRQYANTTYGKSIYWSGTVSGGTTSVIKGGIIATTSAISSLQFTTGGGTSTFSGGQVLIYGVK